MKVRVLSRPAAFEGEGLRLTRMPPWKSRIFHACFLFLSFFLFFLFSFKSHPAALRIPVPESDTERCKETCALIYVNWISVATAGDERGPSTFYFTSRIHRAVHQGRLYRACKHDVDRVVSLIVKAARGCRNGGRLHT